MNRTVFAALLAGAILAAGLLTGCEPPEADAPAHGIDRAVAKLNPTDGSQAAGTVTIERQEDGIRVSAEVEGLDENSRHGFHIHEFGDCTAGDATSAGGHFNPHGTDHGGPMDNVRHVGDMGNLETDENGVGRIDYIDPLLDFEGPENIIGRAVVVHAGEDDMESQPTGEAGPRLACGVIGVAGE